MFSFCFFKQSAAIIERFVQKLHYIQIVHGSKIMLTDSLKSASDNNLLWLMDRHPECNSPSPRVRPAFWAASSPGGSTPWLCCRTLPSTGSGHRWLHQEERKETCEKTEPASTRAFCKMWCKRKSVTLEADSRHQVLVGGDCVETLPVSQLPNFTGVVTTSCG